MRTSPIALVSFALFACGDDSVSTTSTSASGSTSAASSVSTGTVAPTSTITFSATLVPNGAGAPIPGAEVCVYAHPELACATTAPGGTFDVQVPAVEDTGILVSKQGFGSILIPFHTDGDDMTGAILGMPNAPTITSYYVGAGTPYPDPGKGFVAVFFTPGDDYTHGQDGATVTLVPAQGVGPFYTNPMSTAADPMLTATSSSGMARFGAVPPGELEVDALCPTGLVAISNFFGWPSDSADHLRVPIVDGFETRVGFGCY